MTARREHVFVLGLGEALEALRRPWDLEHFSPLAGRALLAVDVAQEAPAGEAELEAARSSLGRLPCVSVALHPEGATRAGKDLLGAFDAFARDEAELAALGRGGAHAPLAALGLVQLLRQGERLDVEGGLLAESLVYATLQAGPEFAGWLAARGPARARAPEDEAPVRAHREGTRLRVVLNRPACHNAFSAAMRDALCEALAVALADPSVESVLLEGAGPSFSSGGDLDEFGTCPDPATAHAIRSTRNAARLLAELAPRLSARVHGACVGAGAELAAFARRVVARPDAWFQLPEIAMGLVPGAGGTLSLPRRIGRQRTVSLALSGERIDARTALAWGLVDAIEG